MKTITFLLATIVLSLNILAQVPDKINYQAIIRDTNGTLVRNQQIRMKVSILLNSDSGSPLYTEIHDAESNENGLVSLEIGNGRTTDLFTAIDWSTGIYFLKTETDPEGNSNFTITGTSQILSVPYSFHAQTVENDKVDDADSDPANELQTLSFSGDDLTISDRNTVTLPRSPWQSSNNSIFYNSGNVGIGTTEPTAELQIIGNDGILFEGNNGSGTIPKTGSGDRFMWYPKKSAFRAGYANGDLWDDAKIGQYSVAMGIGTEASGDWGSTAFGEDTKASGSNAFVTGQGSQATGYISTAFGAGTIAGGVYSMAMGHQTKAMGANSTAMGEITTASGDYSVAMGNNTEALGETSFAMGQFAVANGTQATSVGFYSVANGNYSAAFGSLTDAGSIYSAAFGVFNVGGGTPDTWIGTDPLFEIGNGTIDNGRSNAFTVLKNANVGIGTRYPQRLLHIIGNNPRVLIEASSSNPEINFKSAGDADFDIWAIYKNNSSGDLQFFQNGNKLSIQKNTGYVGIGTPTPQGRLDVNGAIYQRGGMLHADYVFDADYELESIEEHAAFMWQNKHLPAIPKATTDDNGNEIVEVGSHRKGIVEELEKAHIYISQLEKAIDGLKVENENLSTKVINQDRRLEQQDSKLEQLELLIKAIVSK